MGFLYSSLKQLAKRCNKRIQEQLSGTDQDSGRVPRTIECELSEELVDSGVPGDVITVCGVVKVVSTEIEKGEHLL